MGVPGKGRIQSPTTLHSGSLKRIRRGTSFKSLAARHSIPPNLKQIERRDWELWSIALILITVFGGGSILFLYSASLIPGSLPPSIGRFFGLLLFGLIGLVLLLNVYLLDKRRSLNQMRQLFLEQESQIAEQTRNAATDPLTGLYNRRYFDEVMQSELDRAVEQQRGVDVILVDIDNFRKLNQEKGHLQADHVLQEVGAVLKRCVRATDHVFRFGGDELLALLFGAKPDTTPIVEGRVHQFLKSHKRFQQRFGEPLTVSIGAATYKEGNTLEGLVEEAEVNLQAAKAAHMPTASTPPDSAAPN